MALASSVEHISTSVPSVVSTRSILNEMLDETNLLTEIDANMVGGWFSGGNTFVSINEVALRTARLICQDG